MWSYKDAFCRNIGLISETEQQILRNAHIGIAGMGGVGGNHLLTLVRLGINKFTISDDDDFNLVNFNRQVGASINVIGQNKAEVMKKLAQDINPDVQIKITKNITQNNIDDFLDNIDIFIDGIDFFAIDIRRLMFDKIRKNNIWGITAAPLGFGCSWICFDPNGMSFDKYFNISDKISTENKLIYFLLGLSPQLIFKNYMDFSKINTSLEHGPSLGLACQLCGVAATSETIKIMLKRGKVKAAPHYQQFDLYLGKYIQKKLLFGNRNPIQQLRRLLLLKQGFFNKAR